MRKGLQSCASVADNKSLFGLCSIALTYTCSVHMILYCLSHRQASCLAREGSAFTQLSFMCLGISVGVFDHFASLTEVLSDSMFCSLHVKFESVVCRAKAAMARHPLQA